MNDNLNNLVGAALGLYVVHEILHDGCRRNDPFDLGF